MQKKTFKQDGGDHRFSKPDSQMNNQSFIEEVENEEIH